MKTFDELFYSLSCHPRDNVRKRVRQQICERCDVTDGTVANWLHYRYPVPKLARAVVAEILKQHHPGVEEVVFPKTRYDYQQEEKRKEAAHAS